MDNITGFIITSIILSIMPGPDIIFVITQSISQGKKSAIVFILGLNTGLLVHITAATLGLSVILAKSEILFQIIKYLGAAYLIYLGIMAIINRKKEIFNLKDSKKVSNRLYYRGIIMNILNPKVALFFLAFFPQFIIYDGANSFPIYVQMIILGIIFIVQGFIVFSGVAILADKLAYKLMSKNNFSQVVGWIKAAAFIIIGVWIAFSS